MSAGKAAGPIEILMVEDSIDDIQITLGACPSNGQRRYYSRRR